MIEVTRICIMITHILIAIGVVMGLLVSFPVLGLFGIPVVLLVAAPMVVMWLMVVTAWNKYMLGKS